MSGTHASAAVRFWRQVEKTDACWLWKGYRMPNGYGQFSETMGKKWYAHRWAFTCEVGPVPLGLDLDHLCRNRLCVRPSHLEAVTRRTNLLRGATLPAANAAKTHCVHGHEFTPENTARSAVGHRSCRTCSRAADQVRPPRPHRVRPCPHCGKRMTHLSRHLNEGRCRKVVTA